MAHHHQYLIGRSQYHSHRSLASLPSDPIGLSLVGRRWSHHQRFVALGSGVARTLDCWHYRASEQHAALREGLRTISVLRGMPTHLANTNCIPPICLIIPFNSIIINVAVTVVVARSDSRMRSSTWRGS